MKTVSMLSRIGLKNKPNLSQSGVVCDYAGQENKANLGQSGVICDYVEARKQSI